MQTHRLQAGDDQALKAHTNVIFQHSQRVMLVSINISEIWYE
jgi:hypothetical protein